MKSTKVKNLNLNDDVWRASDTINYIDSSLSTALSGMSFHVRSGTSAQIKDILHDLISCVQKIGLAFGCSLYEETQPTTLYYAVKFISYDGTVLDTQIIEEGHSANSPGTPDVRGMNFTGWSTSFQNVHSNLSVYALYEPNIYVVAFDGNGGIPEFISTEVTYGQPYGALPSAAYSGYEFDGWWTKISGDGMLSVVSSDIFNQIEDQTLYAHWIDEFEKYSDEEFLDIINDSVVENITNDENNDEYDDTIFGQLDDEDEEDDMFLNFDELTELDPFEL